MCCAEASASWTPWALWSSTSIVCTTTLLDISAIDTGLQFAACRSCASLGYFTDVVLPLLHKSLPSRKPPIINRGTWARHAVMRQVTHDFVTACTQQHSETTHSQPAAAAEASAEGTAEGTAEASAGAAAPSEPPGSSSAWVSPVCQVVALGAGTDSSWFNLQHQAWELLPAAHFIDLDYQEVGAAAVAGNLSAGNRDVFKCMRACTITCTITCTHTWDETFNWKSPSPPCICMSCCRL